MPLPAASSEKHVKLERSLLVIGVLGLGYNLRGAITSLPPVFPELQDSLHLSSATISILAATPVICFGVVSGFAAGLARRAGEERVLLWAIIALTAGLIARGADPGALLFPGTIVASAENQVFVQVYADVQPHVHYARLYLSRGVEEEADVAAQHLAILDAFREGDGDAARQAIAAHLESVRTHLLKNVAHVRARIGDAGRPKKR